MVDKNGVVLTLAREVPKQDFRDIPWQINMDGTESGMKSFYSAHWCFTRPADPNPPTVRKVGHPPHIHKENEIIMLIGSDPENPYDLGATVELCVGPEMEKHVFTESVTIMIPGGVPHGFYNIVECHRPFLFISSQEASPRTEKFMWDCLTPEELASVKNRDHWKNKGFPED